MSTATALTHADIYSNTQSKARQLATLAQTLYVNRRAYDRSLVPWRNASKAVKREFFQEARQYMGFE